MGHARRMRDQAFHATQRFGQRETGQPVNEGAHSGHAAVQIEAKHGAETRLLPRRQRMPRMAGEARKMHGGHRRMRRQMLGQHQSVFLMRTQPHIQGSQAAQCEVTVERCAGNPGRVGPPCQRFVQCRVGGHHRTADHVAVAVDVFGGGMHHDVRAERDRLLQRRRQEGVVDHHLRADRLRRHGDMTDVGDAQQRVAGSFDPHHGRAARQRRAQRAGIVKIDHRQLEPALAGTGAKQTMRAAIAVVRHHQQLARLKQFQHQSDRRHAAGGDYGTGTAFEFAQRLGKQVAGGIAAAGVIVAALAIEAGE